MSAGALLVLLAVGGLSSCRGRVRAPAPDPAAAAADRTVEFPPRRIISEAELPSYLGSRECVRCHRDMTGQLDTHHARTLAPVRGVEAASRFRRSNRVEDPGFDIVYRAKVAKGRCLLVAAHGGESWEVAPEYAVGSGDRGVTYLGHYQDIPVEVRISYYDRAARWDYTPSQQPGSDDAMATPLGRSLDMRTLESCFRCHTTALVENDSLVQPGRSVLGIGCEACHGPGRAHVAAVKRGERDLRMAHLANVRSRVSIELCGECHRTPASNDLSDPNTQSQLPRLQGLALAQSACFRQSHGALSCVSCHDPHRDATRTTDSTYNTVCRSCHSSPSSPQVVCKRAPQGDCVSCHMPRQVVEVPTNPSFRTHWIRIWPLFRPIQPQSGATRPLRRARGPMG